MGRKVRDACGCPQAEISAVNGNHVNKKTSIDPMLASLDFF